MRQNGDIVASVQGNTETFRCIFTTLLKQLHNSLKSVFAEFCRPKRENQRQFTELFTHCKPGSETYICAATSLLEKIEPTSASANSNLSVNRNQIA